MPIPRAVEMAVAATKAAPARFVTPSGTEVRFPVDAIDQRVRERLVDAIEATPHVPRGRPKRHD